MKDQLLKLLLKQKEECQKDIDHAIQNEKNPFAHGNGTLRLERCREEMERINGEIDELLGKDKVYVKKK